MNCPLCQSSLTTFKNIQFYDCGTCGALVRDALYYLSPEEEKKALSRSAICDECPEKKHNDHLKFFYCDECGCPLSKKIYSTINSCPLKKWKI